MGCQKARNVIKIVILPVDVITFLCSTVVCYWPITIFLGRQKTEKFTMFAFSQRPRV